MGPSSAAPISPALAENFRSALSSGEAYFVAGIAAAFANLLSQNRELGVRLTLPFVSAPSEALAGVLGLLSFKLGDLASDAIVVARVMAYKLRDADPKLHAAVCGSFSFFSRVSTAKYFETLAPAMFLLSSASVAMHDSIEKLLQSGRSG